MSSFVEAILAPSNLWLTVLLGLCCVYWLIVVVGGISADALDIDLDVDADPGVDVDSALDSAIESAADSHTGAGTDTSHPSVRDIGVATGVLRFFNLGDVPLMVVLTVLLLVMWSLSVALYPITRSWTPLAQFAMLAPLFVVATLLMKVATWPVKKLFRAMREEERQAQRLELIGKVCRVISSQVTPTVGQAEFPTSGAPLLLNVRTKNNDALSRGDEAVIVGQDEHTGVYYVRGF